METFAKILALTVLGIFGSAGAIIYYSDPANTKPAPVAEDRSLWNLEQYSGVDVREYRKQILENYKGERAIEKRSGGKSEYSLWGQSFEGNASDNVISKEALKLAEGNSVEALEERTNQLYNLYRTLQAQGSPEYSRAYAEYKAYWAALKLKTEMTSN
ncbi:MAG: hypothetical protein ACT4NX_03415 [Deltaproteobacteria bacterium]